MFSLRAWYKTLSLLGSWFQSPETQVPVAACESAWPTKIRHRSGSSKTGAHTQYIFAHTATAMICILTYYALRSIFISHQVPSLFAATQRTRYQLPNWQVSLISDRLAPALGSQCARHLRTVFIAILFRNVYLWLSKYRRQGCSCQLGPSWQWHAARPAQPLVDVVTVLVNQPIRALGDTGGGGRNSN